MKTALLLLLFCLAEADDIRWEVKDLFQKFKSQLEGQHADMASRLSASETNMEEFQTRSEKLVEELQKHKADMDFRLSASETKMEEFQTRLSQSETLVEELQKHKADMIADHSTISHNLTLDYTQLQTLYDALTLERDQLQHEVNQLKRQTADKTCPSEWKLFGDSCYYMITTGKTWQDGRQECLNQGADLVVINSGEEQAFIRGWNRETAKGTGSWIGLKRTEGTWTWVDGTPLTTQYWHSGYPKGALDCGVYSYTLDPGTYFNLPCSNAILAICEK